MQPRHPEMRRAWRAHQAVGKQIIQEFRQSLPSLLTPEEEGFFRGHVAIGMLSGGSFEAGCWPNIDDQNAILLSTGLVAYLKQYVTYAFVHPTEVVRSELPGPVTRDSLRRSALLLHVVYRKLGYPFGPHIQLNLSDEKRWAIHNCAMTGIIFVLAHEVGHAIKHHGVAGLEDEALCIQSDNEIRSKLSHEQELEADAFGFHLTCAYVKKKFGTSPALAFLAVWTAFSALGSAEGHEASSSHPSPIERIRRVATLVPDNGESARRFEESQKETLPDSFYQGVLGDDPLARAALVRMLGEEPISKEDALLILGDKTNRS